MKYSAAGLPSVCELVVTLLNFFAFPPHLLHLYRHLACSLQWAMSGHVYFHFNIFCITVYVGRSREDLRMQVRILFVRL